MVDIIGIDCSTDDARVAVAVGSATADGAQVRRVVVCGGAVGRAADVIGSQLRPGVATLLALDAPLGWPAALGAALTGHRAGELLPDDSNALFRRHTDQEVKRVIGQQPLDVGADRIARTAHWALRLLHDVGSRRSAPVPLAWQPEEVVDLSAIEVYPAATMKARGISAKSYKKSDQGRARKLLIRELRRHIVFPADLREIEQCADAIDAAVCVLAGADFLKRLCMEPTNRKLAKQEGWIWVVRPTTPYTVERNRSAAGLTSEARRPL